MHANTIGLLNRLSRQGVQLSLNEQGQLVSQSPREAITAETGQLIREQREAIIACLRARQAFAAPIRASGESSGPLSASQSGLWFIEQYQQGTALYNMPVYFRLHGSLDVAALDYAFQALGARHASLRTCFVRNAEGQGEQRILATSALRLEIEDLGELTLEQREQRIAQRVREAIERPFDLASGNLTRVQLLRLASDEHLLMITQHHIISDGWSVKNLFADLKAAFLAYQDGREPDWTPPALTCVDYARWFNSALFRDYHQQYRPYWVERLAGIPEVHSLPLDHPRPALPASGGELVFSNLDYPHWERFKQLCQRHKASPFIGLHALFALLLARHSGERDIVIGTPLAYRERPDIEPLLGFFVNTLVLRSQLPEQQSFSDYLQQCRRDDLEAFDHQLFRFEALGEALGMPRHVAINPIFQIMLVYQARVDFDDLIPGCRALEQTSPVLPAKTDLSVKVTELGDVVRIDWLFATALFERGTVERYAARLLNLLDAVLEAPDTDIWALRLEDASRENAEAERLARLPRGYADQRSVLDRFDAMVRACPRQPALGLGAGALSYAELDARANRLAHWLLARGCQGQRIGLLARREDFFLVAVLGIWKAGAAYVPLDPSYPAERLGHMLADASIDLVLGWGAPAFATGEAQWIDLDDAAMQCQLDAQPAQAPALGRTPEQLAQVIYTSGSTGLPKGVMIEQGALLNLLDDHAERLRLEAQGRMLCCMSLSFDAGNLCALLPLVCGASLVWGEPDASLPAQIEAAAVSHLILPTALLASLPASALPSLRAIGFGGETCPPVLVERWAARVLLVNMYGPTEATVTALCKTLAPGSRVSIGQPIRQMHALVLDGLGRLCPQGVPGELCLAGVGLARGYLNQPQRTAEAFREHLVGGLRVRLYHTGDRVRQGTDGDFEYLGRLDEQIKLRGYRIEPGEIEAQLAAAEPALRQVRVRLLRDGQRQALVAYADLQPDAARPEADAVLHAAAQRLPEYMLPSRLLLLDALPLTANGKLDTRRLPRVDLAAGVTRTPPCGDLEAGVLAAWEALLGQPLGVEDDFFELGGDSILSIQLATRLCAAGFSCTVREVFEARTVRRLCRVMQGQHASRVLQAEQGTLVGEFPLQPIQRWFFEQPFAEPQHWNQGVLLRLPENVDPAWLEAALTRLLEQHDALRLAVDEDGQRYLPRLTPAPLARLDAARLGEQGLQQALTALQADFAPAQGRTLAWALVEGLAPGPGLFLCFHHLVIDAVSWRILADDLALLWRGETLPAKTSSYRQWGAALADYCQREAAQLAFWQARLVGMPAAAPGLRTTEPRPPALLELDAVTTRRLLRGMRQRHGAEVREWLLAALTKALADVGLGSRQWILLEGHGREAIDPAIDVSRTLGWFTSMFPVQLVAADWADLLRQARSQLQESPDRGVGFLPLRAAQAPGQRPALPWVALNYLGESPAGGGEWQPLGVAPGAPSSRRNPCAELVSLHGGIYAGRLTLRQIGCLAQPHADRLLGALRGQLLQLAETLDLTQEMPA